MFTIVNTQSGKLIPEYLTGTLGFQTIVKEGETCKRITMRINIKKDLSPQILYHVYNHNNLTIMGTANLVDAINSYNSIKTQPVTVGKEEEEHAGNIF